MPDVQVSCSHLLLFVAYDDFLSVVPVPIPAPPSQCCSSVHGVDGVQVQVAASNVSLALQLVLVMLQRQHLSGVYGTVASNTQLLFDAVFEHVVTSVVESLQHLFVSLSSHVAHPGQSCVLVMSGQLGVVAVQVVEVSPAHGSVQVLVSVADCIQ